MPIDRNEVTKAQQAWGDGIIAIGEAFAEGKDYVQVARDHIERHYAYDLGAVLFKPTLASEKQFRTTAEEAESYFVGQNGVCPEDGGFALRAWTQVRFQNAGMILHGDVAMCMGNYYFTDARGEEIKVEYTLCYVKSADDKLKIAVQHSSLPYSPPDD